MCFGSGGGASGGSGGGSWVGYAMMAASALKSASDSSKANGFTSKQLKQQAKAERAAYEVRAVDREKRKNAYMASQLQTWGSSGFVSNVGTATDLTRDTASAFAAEDVQDKYNVNRQERSLLGNAQSYDISAKSAWGKSVFDVIGSIGASKAR